MRIITGILISIILLFRLLLKYHRKLSGYLLGYILYAISLCDFTGVGIDDLELNPNQSYAPSKEHAVPACLFIAQLPLKWIESVMCANQLPVESEFQRYELTKMIFRLRSAAPDSLVQARISNTTLIDDWDENETIKGGSPKKEEKEEKENNSEVKTVKKTDLASVTSSILEFFTSSGKKRKLEQLEDNLILELGSIENNGARIIAKPNLSSKKHSTPLKLPLTLANIYQNGIVYSYMNFAELGSVLLVYFNLLL